MSFDYTNNPDYPTNTGSFAQHTYQNQQQVGNGFYYAGFGLGTTPIVDTGMRRFDPSGAQPQYGYPQQPMAQPVPQQPIPTGVGQMLNAQEQGVMPFSSYPPSGANTQQPTQYGFNQMMTDARRADANSVQNVGNNPWASQSSTVPQQPIPNVAPVQSQPMMNTGYVYGCNQNNAAGYMCQSAPQPNQFERTPGVNMWDNMYVQPQPYVQTNPSQIQWQQPQQQSTQFVYTFPSQTPNPTNVPLPSPQVQPVSWTDLSKKSWG